MFQFTQEPSSGSQSQCLAKITGMDPVDMCVVSVTAAYATVTLTMHISTSTVEPYL